ncbi:uncharacterized protein LOC141850754 [Brevipalpus obovatus]|uniref:uncharacterized protein LOC141850754 n=1 Tax=Brevipalpus obovatus TaxID=246614 RepID=UPI003D9E6755
MKCFMFLLLMCLKSLSIGLGESLMIGLKKLPYIDPSLKELCSNSNSANTQKNSKEVTKLIKSERRPVEKVCFTDQLVKNKMNLTIKDLDYLESINIFIDAICIKGPIRWCKRSNENVAGQPRYTLPPKLHQHLRHKMSKLHRLHMETGGEGSMNERGGDQWRAYRMPNDYRLRISEEKSGHRREKKSGHDSVMIVSSGSTLFSGGNDILLDTHMDQTIKLACLLSVNHFRTIVWKKNGHNLDLVPTMPKVSSSLTKLIANNDSDTSQKYQIFHHAWKHSMILTLLIISVVDSDISGQYTCHIDRSHGDFFGSFILKVPSSSLENMDYKVKEPNVVGFILGMLPSLAILVYIIMKLGYRSRYAIDQEEEEEAAMFPQFGIFF